MASWPGDLPLQDSKQNISDLEFEDDFDPKLNKNPDRLPDSEEYVSRLEKRLKKVKNVKTPQNLLDGLKEAKDSVMLQLTDQSSNIDFANDQENHKHEIGLSYIEQKLFPDKVALNSEELLHLVKADVLQTITTEITDTSDNQSNTSR